MMTWKPDNWKSLSDEQKAELKTAHKAENKAKRQAFWGKVKRLIVPLIRKAAAKADLNGDEKHDWVVRQLQLGADKIASVPGPWGVAIEVGTDALIYSPLFVALADGWVDDAFEILEKELAEK